VANKGCLDHQPENQMCFELFKELKLKKVLPKVPILENYQ